MLIMINVNEIKLKPCPFCGGKAVFGTISRTWIECTECGVETLYDINLEKLVKLWNTRKSMDNIIEEVARRDTTDGTVKVFSGKEVIDIIKKGGMDND